MGRLAALYILLDLILFVAAGKRNKSVRDLTLLMQSVPAEKLQCYHCQQNHHGCLSLANVSQVPVMYCDIDQPHCMVERLEAGGKLTEFARSCASECYPGCEWGVTYIRCTSCCNTSRCNVDSQSTSNLANDTLVLLTGVLATLLLR